MNTQHNEMMQALDVFTAERDRLREVNAELLAALASATAATDCKSSRKRQDDHRTCRPSCAGRRRHERAARA